MRVVYLNGRRTNFQFMGFATVVSPETVRILPPEHIKYYEDGQLSFHRHYISLKAALRQIKKQDYPKGTILHLRNWYVGYADVFVYV